jgi:O-antigen/teichoic acid export membrane protein
MVALGAALIPGALVYSLCAVADRLILGWFSGNAEVAVFALAGAVAGVALVLKAAFSRTWEPYAVDWIATRDESVYLPRMQAAADLIAPVIVIATLMSLAWADTIFAVIFPDAYAGAGKLLPVLVLAGMSGTLTLLGNLTELISGRARYRMPVYSIGLVVNVAVCLAFIPGFGAYAAAFGVLAGELAILVSWIVLGKWLLRNLNLNWTVSWSLLGLSLVLCVAYRPGQLVPQWVLGEQLLLTVLCAFAAWMIARRAIKKLQVLALAGPARTESMNAAAGN